MDGEEPYSLNILKPQTNHILSFVLVSYLYLGTGFYIKDGMASIKFSDDDSWK